MVLRAQQYILALQFDMAKSRNGFCKGAKKLPFVDLVGQQRPLCPFERRERILYVIT